MVFELVVVVAVEFVVLVVLFVFTVELAVELLLVVVAELLEVPLEILFVLFAAGATTIPEQLGTNEFTKQSKVVDDAVGHVFTQVVLYKVEIDGATKYIYG